MNSLINVKKAFLFLKKLFFFEISIPAKKAVIA